MDKKTKVGKVYIRANYISSCDKQLQNPNSLTQ